MARHSLSERKFRSLLFVPGNRPDRFDKAWGSGSDAVILDLEDGVPKSEKSAARNKIRESIVARSTDGPTALLRINSFTTPHWRKDIEESPLQHFSGIVLPKCESVEEIYELEKVLLTEESQNNLAAGAVGLFLLIESARGVSEAAKLVQASDRVVGLIFGGEDFCLDMGIQRTEDGHELTFARSAVALCARAYQRLAIDTIYANFADGDGLLRDARMARQAGFSGKLAIHPRQIDAIHSVFAATPEELATARKIVEVFRDAEAKGQGAVELAGKMLDRPVVERARQLLRSAGIQE